MIKPEFNVQNSIHRLDEYVRLLPLKIKTKGEGDLNHKPNPGKWSKKEILGHLVDSALNNLQRFTTAMNGKEKLVVQAYPQDDLVRINNYQELPVLHILLLWQSLNRQILEVVKNLDEAALQIPVSIPYMDMETDLGWLIDDYVKHMEHHFRQIFPSLEDIRQLNVWHLSEKEGIENLQTQREKGNVILMEHGSMSFEIYAPDNVDRQSPHRQDELYIVISGHGMFFLEGQRRAFTAGDAIFVPAGMEHRFEDFSDDFKTWVIFYGPDGGEMPFKPFFEQSRSFNGEQFLLSTDPGKLDIDVIHQFLTHSYWAKGRLREVVEKSAFYSLNVGLYKDGQQVGFARIITDYAVVAYLADVFILEKFRGIGLSKWMMDNIFRLDALSNIKKWILHTKDAHGLYKKYGFSKPENLDLIMEKRIPS